MRIRWSFLFPYGGKDITLLKITKIKVCFLHFKDSHLTQVYLIYIYTYICILGWTIFTVEEKFFFRISFWGHPSNSKNNSCKISAWSNNRNLCQLVEHLSSLILHSQHWFSSAFSTKISLKDFSFFFNMCILLFCIAWDLICLI